MLHATDENNYGGDETDSEYEIVDNICASESVPGGTGRLTETQYPEYPDSSSAYLSDLSMTTDGLLLVESRHNRDCCPVYDARFAQACKPPSATTS